MQTGNEHRTDGGDSGLCLDSRLMLHCGTVKQRSLRACLAPSVEKLCLGVGWTEEGLFVSLRRGKGQSGRIYKIGSLGAVLIQAALRRMSQQLLMCKEVQRGKKTRRFGEVVPFWLALVFIVGSTALSGAVATNRYSPGCPGNRETGFVTW